MRDGLLANAHAAEFGFTVKVSRRTEQPSVLRERAEQSDLSIDPSLDPKPPTFAHFFLNFSSRSLVCGGKFCLENLIALYLSLSLPTV